MDAKALAKSKRAHSQHHKNKSYPHQKAKAPTVSSNNAGTAGKPLGKQVGEKTRQAQRISRLPSNWDRYEDEFDLDIEDQSGDSTSQASDVVVPKSKGADYCYLIAEAQSQAQSQSYSYSDSFPYLDDVMPEGIIQGASSMLAVRGEGILSWVGDDNFILEDKTAAVQEASFLSLNLNAVAEQLEKVDLSQRLFVEAYLLPLELGTERSVASSNQGSSKVETMHKSEAAASKSEDLADFSEKGAEGSMASINQEPDWIQTTQESEAAANISKDSGFNKLSENFNTVNSESTSFGSRTYDATLSSRGPDLVNQDKDDLSYSHFGKAGQRKVLEPMGQVKVISAAVSEKEVPKFEAAAAEAELDMLLNSFGQAKFLDSSSSKSINPSGFQQECSTAPQLSRKGPDLSKPPSVNASFDDVLDNLLEETSTLMNQDSFSHSQDVKVVSHDTQPSTSHSVTKSKVLDNFDSWLDTI